MKNLKYFSVLLFSIFALSYASVNAADNKTNAKPLTDAQKKQVLDGLDTVSKWWGDRANSKYTIPKLVNYKTDVNSLPEVHKAQFLLILNTLNRWWGDRATLERIEPEIDYLIALQPGFLPAYVEKARLIIMTSNGRKDWMALSKQALRILEEVQEKDPAYAKAFVLAGHAYFNQREYAKSEQTLNQAKELSAGKRDPWLYNNLSDLHGILGHKKQAYEYAKRALFLTQGNDGALISSIRFINNFISESDDKIIHEKIVDVIKAHHKTEEDLQRILQRLYYQSPGQAQNSFYVDNVAAHLFEQKPKSAETYLFLLRLAMQNGYIHTYDGISVYRDKYIETARKIMMVIENDKSIANDLIMIQVEILLHDKKYSEILAYLAEAENNNLSQKAIDVGRARLYTVQKKYEKVVSIYEKHNLAMDGPLQLAYVQTRQFKKVDDYYQRRLKFMPRDATILANYARFLMYSKNDIPGAIEFGERAVMIRPNAVTLSNLKLAYLMDASIKLKSGDTKTAKHIFDYVKSSGYEQEYISENCTFYCVGIMAMEAQFTNSIY